MVLPGRPGARSPQHSWCLPAWPASRGLPGGPPPQVSAGSSTDRHRSSGQNVLERGLLALYPPAAVLGTALCCPQMTQGTSHRGPWGLAGSLKNHRLPSSSATAPTIFFK